MHSDVFQSYFPKSIVVNVCACCVRVFSCSSTKELHEYIYYFWCVARVVADSRQSSLALAGRSCVSRVDLSAWIANPAAVSPTARQGIADCARGQQAKAKWIDRYFLACRGAETVATHCYFSLPLPTHQRSLYPKNPFVILQAWHYVLIGFAQFNRLCCY